MHTATQTATHTATQTATHTATNAGTGGGLVSLFLGVSASIRGGALHSFDVRDCRYVCEFVTLFLNFWCESKGWRSALFWCARLQVYTCSWLLYVYEFVTPFLGVSTSVSSALCTLLVCEIARIVRVRDFRMSSWLLYVYEFVTLFGGFVRVSGAAHCTLLLCEIAGVCVWVRDCYMCMSPWLFSGVSASKRGGALHSLDVRDCRCVCEFVTVLCVWVRESVLGVSASIRGGALHSLDVRDVCEFVTFIRVWVRESFLGG